MIKKRTYLYSALPILLILGMIGSSMTVGAQTDTGSVGYPVEEYWLSLEYQSEFDAPGLSNVLLGDLWNGGYISRSRLDEAYDKLLERPGNHIAGMASRGNVKYSIREISDSVHRHTYTFGFGHTAINEAAYDDDLFGMIFFGNKSYAGTELSFTDQGFRSTSVQNITFSHSWTTATDSTTRIAGWSISFLKGQYNQEAEIRSANVYTHPLGDLVSFDMDYAYVRSDTQYTSYLDMNGYGLGIGGSFMYSKDYLFISARMENFGMMRWVNNRYQFEKDSSFTYEGWEIPNIFQADNFIFEGATPDSAASLLTGKRTGYSKWRPSPAYFTADISYYFLRLGVDYYLFTRYTPRFHAALPFTFFNRTGTGIAPYYQFGGYGKGHFGLELRLARRGRYQLDLNLGAIDALVSAKKKTGMYASVRFIHNLNR